MNLLSSPYVKEDVTEYKNKIIEERKSAMLIPYTSIV